ncbi:Squalene--hopene cyclase [Gemmata obscuriglobus]|uniref:2,3-oxidosqualene cyclase n=1 Tax=Gemmata obscuriglobus TaxID=114 RepID=A0A2Z3HEJ7_9BACT|nr:2,3-oxidosqualene cyclase [Gemmata obscuriglobus]AWM39690.1 2,3-oxidosqualene cyclase [Gemmata obscuriglobus]QEG27202.1 Squalene--hopene cyclase [Gemmata obscuriglobus]VTS03905.1 squalene--hopene cyclase : Squalene cyclase family protein OS=Methylococcus capsulatus (strain ATCC 33009 / NCIMB 11132 / Bath) GN=MCA2873 PE=4 SV=1: Prenyltrans_1 [Gemmata obscuriglobus UQM 2246]
MPHDPTARAAARLTETQQPAGCWEGEMIWCPVVTAQVAITRHVVGMPFSDADAAKIIRHFEFSQLPNGAFGLHPEHPGSVFVTTLVYVAARCLGVSAEHAVTAKARGWLHAQPGGVLSAPTWGKFWLTLLGLYGRDGLRPLLPELALLPKAFPVHPVRFYCHTRYVYLVMSLLQGAHATFDLGPLRAELERELYGPLAVPESFRQYRYRLAETDAFEPPNLFIRVAERVMGWYDRVALPGLRRAALKRCADLIDLDLDANGYLTLSPVNGTLNALALFARGADREVIAKCVSGFEFYRFDDPERGLRYSGGSTRTWDTGFALEALLANPAVASVYRDVVHRGYRFLAAHQMSKSVAGRDPSFPDTARGGWCLGDGGHAWPVSDCTAEALSAVLSAHTHGMAPEERIPDARLIQAAEFMLTRQNRDGGFGSYERARSPRWLERMNPSEMFTRCMTDQSYIECTGSCLVALGRFRKAIPHHAAGRITRATNRGARFLLSRQRPDGAFPGAWGVYLTYGTFHAVRGLRAAGYAPSHRALQRAANWLIATQKRDGGWGEDYHGCLRQEYVEHPESQATMTSWAIVALCETVGTGHPAVQKGAAWLASRQRADGSYPREAVNGVFFGTAMLDYDLYRAYFPTWALALASGTTAKS